MRKKKRVLSILWPLGFGTVLLFIPLLRDVHIESAILISIIFCFIGAIQAVHRRTRNDVKVIGRRSFQILLISIPLLVHGFIAECITLSGIGFWVLLPIPSLLFGVSIGRFFRLIKFPAAKLFTILIILLVGLGIWIYEFFTLPQVYYFNHVWGAWPGPIYDEEIRITSGLIWFRLSTLLWVLILWWLPSVSTSLKSKIGVAFVGFILLSALLFQPQLGISTPREYLKSELTAVENTEHFNLYFDTSNFNAEERDYWAKRHEFHFQQIIELLKIDWPQGRKIESFIYANAWQKKELVGAKFTSYVPVWLEQDQLHIAKEHLDGVLKHELVHVIAKQFGNDLFNASWSIGLIEGVAEAIAKDASGVSTLDQIIASENPLPTTDQIRTALTISGFYASASSISYTTTGSFVGYLLQNYPVEQFKAAYPASNFEQAYQLPLDTLVNRWKAQLPIQEIDSVDVQVSQRIFSQLSLFQMNCPRKIHPILQGLDQLRFHESLDDSVNALSTINELNARYSDMPLVKQLWASYQLRNAGELEIINNVYESDSTLAMQLMRADAFFINNNYTISSDILNKLRSDTLYVNDLNTNDSFLVRTDSTTWAGFVNARYRNSLVDSSTFIAYPEPLQWLLVDRALSSNLREKLEVYATTLKEQPVHPRWFETQEDLINKLAYFGYFDLAQEWISLLQSTDLRLRFLDRIEEQQEWLNYLKAN